MKNRISQIVENIEVINESQNLNEAYATIKIGSTIKKTVQDSIRKSANSPENLIRNLAADLMDMVTDDEGEIVNEKANREVVDFFDSLEDAIRSAQAGYY